MASMATVEVSGVLCAVSPRPALAEYLRLRFRVILLVDR